MKLKERLILFLKGLFMGLADIIPGVSGGTIALITGIYERFIAALKSIDPRDLKNIDFNFLVPVGLGMASAFLLASRVIMFFLENYSSEVYTFFFGLILASSFVVYKRKAVVNEKNITVAVLGFLVSYVVISLEYFQFGHGPLVIFFSGFLAICAMILPGVSGSFVVLMLGQYEYLLGSVKNFVWEDIGLFVLGGMVSIAGFSRVLRWFLENYKELTLSFMVGLMVGALRLPLGEIAISESFTGNVFILFSGLVGIGSVLLLELKMK